MSLLGDLRRRRRCRDRQRSGACAGWGDVIEGALRRSLSRPTSSGWSSSRTPASRSRRSQPPVFSTAAGRDRCTQAGSLPPPCSSRNSTPLQKIRDRYGEQSGPSAPPGSRGVQHSLRHLRRIAFGNGPCARRVQDQCALARDQPFVVGGIVPRRHVRRKERHQLSVSNREPAARCRFCTATFPSGIHDLGPKGLEERADRVDGLAGLTETDAEGKAALMAGLCRFQERVRRPVVRPGRCAGRIHLLNVDVGDTFSSDRCGEQGPVIWLPIQAGTPSHSVSGLAEIFDGAIDFTASA